MTSGEVFSRKRTDRLARILDVLSDDETVTVPQLASAMGVSAATIRRDLVILDTQGLVRRSHGGASMHTAHSSERPVRYRDGHHRDAKQRIGAACAETIPLRVQAIAMSGGTTTREVARHLVDRSGLTVVTNSLTIAMELTMRPRLRVIVTGGQLRSESFEMVGAWTERFLDGLNFGMTIMGVDGISASGGLTTHDPVEARANQRMIERSQRTIVVADATKIGAVTMARIADVSRISLLITEADAPAREIVALRATGLEVMLL